MKGMNPFLAVDGYKIFHHLMSPEGTTLIYSNFTPRAVKYAPKGCEEILVFGTQMTIREIVNNFNENFFKRDRVAELVGHDVTMYQIECGADEGVPDDIIADAEAEALVRVKKEVMDEIQYEYNLYTNSEYDVSKIAALWDLGYLPMVVKGIPEGEFVPPGIPVMTLYNTLDEFAWVTNFLETMISNLLWKPMTSATLGYEFKKLNDSWIAKTDPGNDFHSQFGCHDFSMRGLDSVYAAMSSGLGHALSHSGSDSLPTIHAGRQYYDAEGFVVGSIPATEHSIQCAYYHNSGTDYEYVKTLIERFPSGPLGLVSDGFDLWKLIMEVLPRLKDQIMAREGGPVVFRPDSGDPVEIMTGKYFDVYECADHDDYRTLISEYKNSDRIINMRYEGVTYEYICDNMRSMINEYGWENGMSDSPMDELIAGDILRVIDTTIGSEPADKGVVELLWDLFGGEVNSKGMKVLHPSVRVIYGDAINLDRFNLINERLAAKGFASTNWVAGIGSFTYQWNTRDTFGFACKSTYQEVTNLSNNGRSAYTTGINIFKDPITDDGTKKSAKGLLRVEKTDKGYLLKDEQLWDDEGKGALQTIFLDGTFQNVITLEEIRAKLV